MANITSSGAIVISAGANVSTAIPEVAYNMWASGAEAYVAAETSYNWSDQYTNLSNDVQGVIHNTVTYLAAMDAIAYDMSGYTSRSEAQTMLDFLRDRSKDGIKTIKESKTKTFIQEAT